MDTLKHKILSMWLNINMERIELRLKYTRPYSIL